MKRIFIHDESLREVFRKNGVTESSIRMMEIEIMRGAGDTIAGTAGLKKIRCGSAGRGKSGSVRVIFADYPKVGRTYLITAFGKNEKDNISMAERNNLAKFKKHLDRVMEGLM